MGYPEVVAEVDANQVASSDSSGPVLWKVVLLLEELVEFGSGQVSDLFWLFMMMTVYWIGWLHEVIPVWLRALISSQLFEIAKPNQGNLLNSQPRVVIDRLPPNMRCWKSCLSVSLD